MVILKQRDDGLYDVEWTSPSWYNSKAKNVLTKMEALYISLIQKTINIQDAHGNWIPYDMTSHELEWHLDDVALRGPEAKTRIVKKSRNTSFSTCVIISDIFATANYDNLIVPYVKISDDEAKILIQQGQKIAEHTNPVNEGDLYFPFNKAESDFSKRGSLRINNTTIKAYPANANSVNNIRGLRNRGNCGVIDEANFIPGFLEIFSAMNSTTAGSIDGEQHKQINIGTTLKGTTPFSIWLDDIEQKRLVDISIYDWPVFERSKFDKYINGECNIPFHENDELITIVPWHSKKNLWSLWQLDQKTFLEEYMGVCKDRVDQLFPTDLIREKSKIVNDITLWSTYKHVYGGCDPASVNDYFSISLTGEKEDGTLETFYVWNKTNIDLKKGEQECEFVLDLVTNMKLFSIDATPIGLHITQNLKNKYGDKIRGITGNTQYTGSNGIKIRLNEYMLMRLKELLMTGKLLLCDDELSIMHFLQFNNRYEAERNQYGHGDTVSSMLYALAPESKSTYENKFFTLSLNKVL